MISKPANYHQPNYPNVAASVTGLKNGDLAHVEPVLYFLERDPCVLGSGYLKEQIWRYLLRVELSEKQHERLRQVTLHYVKTRIGREFFPMCRFMRRISTEKFAAPVRILANSPDNKTERRALILLSYLHSIRQGEEARRRLFWHWASTR
jgi:hypothetical protein